EKTITNHPFAALQGRPDFFAHQLTAARGKKKQFGFRSHGVIFFGMLEQMPNGLANCGAAGLTNNSRYDPALFQSCGEPFHLRRFSAAFGAFERDQRHGHDFAAKGRACRTPPTGSSTPASNPGMASVRRAHSRSSLVGRRSAEP